MLFLSADIIAPILTKFYNVSVETETVISDWKLSKVTPIYKGTGSKDEAGNYRPIGQFHEERDKVKIKKYGFFHCKLIALTQTVLHVLGKNVFILFANLFS